MRIAYTFVILSIIAVLVLGPRSGSASTEIWDDTVDSCPGDNCSSLRIPGSLLAFGAGVKPWVVNVFGSVGQCIRLDVTSETHDLEMVVIAPDNSVFRNDDRVLGDTRPLVKIDPAPREGWYTVHIASHIGTALTEDFVLLYGRYNHSNHNCTDATAVAAAATPNAKPQGAVEDLIPGGPSSAN
jgi:hypothetical protein